MQVVNFVKTNWFAFGLAAIVIFAIARKNSRFSEDGPQPEPRAKTPEKFTDEGPREAGISLSGFRPGGDRRDYAFPEIEAETARAFFRRFGKTAVEERKKFGVPASVALATAYVNSFAGGRDLATEANNIFAQTCGENWNGSTVSAHGQCYRRYTTAWDGWRDFGLRVSGSEWFAEARKSAGKDPKKWLQVLGNQGISDVDNFAETALQAIETHGLRELDAIK